MRLTRFLLGAAAAAPLALSACGGEDGSTFDLQLQVKDCAGTNVLLGSGTTELRVIVTGDGISTPIVGRYPVEAGRGGSAELPSIPYGKNRVVTVEGLGGRPADVVAIGRSAPFDTDESDTPNVTVAMAAVNRFTRPGDEATGCAEMVEARGGHTAVAMRDGRVLLVGGFSQLDPQLDEGRGFLATAEIYDPAQARFVAVDPPCEGDRCYRGAFGQGVLLNDGKVLVTGGVGGDPDEPTAISTAAIFNPATSKWTVLDMNVARRGHTATLLRGSGRVLVVGGIDAEGKVLDSIEIFSANPAPGSFALGSASQKIPAVREDNGPGRAYHTAVARDDLNLVIIGGGIDANERLAPSVIYFRMENGEIKPVTQVNNRVALLGTPVLQAGGAMINGRFAMVAGATTWEAGRAGGVSRGTQAAELPSKPAEWLLSQAHFARRNPCVASLGADKALVVGGLAAGGTVLREAELLAWNYEKSQVESSYAGGPTAPHSRMGTARAFASCTPLGDGRVLVAGGATDQAGNAATRNAEIYVAKP